MKKYANTSQKHSAANKKKQKIVFDWSPDPLVGWWNRYIPHPLESRFVSILAPDAGDATARAGRCPMSAGG